jgi:hypothetical protein
VEDPQPRRDHLRFGPVAEAHARQERPDVDDRGDAKAHHRGEVAGVGPRAQPLQQSGSRGDRWRCGDVQRSLLRSVGGAEASTGLPPAGLRPSRARQYDAGRRRLLDPAVVAPARTWNTREPSGTPTGGRGTGDGPAADAPPAAGWTAA